MKNDRDKDKDKGKAFILHLPADLHLTFKIEAAKRETTMRALILEALEEYMARAERKGVQ